MRTQLSCFLFLSGTLIFAACGKPPVNIPNSNAASPAPSPTAPKEGGRLGEIPNGDAGLPIAEVQFFGKGDVLLCRKDGDCLRLINGTFRSGDRLRIGENSSVKVDCPGIFCQLPPGEYETCCGNNCMQIAQMKRVSAGDNPPVISKADLPPGELQAFTLAETNIRNQQLGPATTQFLVTRLYSSWNLKETTQQVDLLDTELKKPEAKRELQLNYNAIRGKTTDIQKQVNQNDKAKELLKSNLQSESVDPLEKAATHVRLADSYDRSGEKKEAVKNLEKAKEIYATQGEGTAVQKTDDKIKIISASPAIERQPTTLVAPTRRPPK